MLSLLLINESFYRNLFTRLSLIFYKMENIQRKKKKSFFCALGKMERIITLLSCYESCGIHNSWEKKTTLIMMMTEWRNSSWVLFLLVVQFGEKKKKGKKGGALLWKYALLLPCQPCLPKVPRRMGIIILLRIKYEMIRLLHTFLYCINVKKIILPKTERSGEWEKVRKKASLSTFFSVLLWSRESSFSLLKTQVIWNKKRKKEPNGMPMLKIPFLFLVF